MTKHFFQILLCDDNVRFAQTLSEGIKRRLESEFGLSRELAAVSTCTHLDQVEKNVREKKWDMLLCDLGWGDLTLEGIQILHNARIEFSALHTLLYTAQDENEAVDQALQWKLGFVDHVVRIDDGDYVGKMAKFIWEAFRSKRIQLIPDEDRSAIKNFLEQIAEHSAVKDAPLPKSSERISEWTIAELFPEINFAVSRPEILSQTIEDFEDLEDTMAVKFRGIRILDAGHRQEFKSVLTPELLRIHKSLIPLLSDREGKRYAADIFCAPECVEIKLRENPLDQKMQKFYELEQNLKRFPRLEAHEVIALDKTRFIDFVKNRYGGFPQMAAERGLDLNNIYRVNRKFRESPFIVFKIDTVREIVGIKHAAESDQILRQLLASLPTIRRATRIDGDNS